MTGFVKATKAKAKLRLAMFGTPGAGKTYSALAIATGLGSKIAVIDSERGSASKYSDIFNFDVVDLETKKIDEYIRYMNMASQAGYDVLIIDSLSHAWAELLEDIDRIAKTKGGNTWAAWSEGTPLQKRFVNALLSMNCHVIATMRSKVEYVQEQGKNGKMRPVKVGLAPEQGKGIEYEFDMLMEISPEHYATVSKDRTGRFQDEIIEKPGREFGEQLKAWLNSGAEAVTKPAPVQETPKPSPTAYQPELATEKQIKMFFAMCQEAYGDNWKDKGKELVTSTGRVSTKDLTKLEMSELINKLAEQIDSAKTKINTDKTVYDQVMNILGQIKTQEEFNSNSSKINSLIVTIKDPKLHKEAEDVAEMLMDNLMAESVQESGEGDLFNA